MYNKYKFCLPNNNTLLVHKKKVFGQKISFNIIILSKFYGNFCECIPFFSMVYTLSLSPFFRHIFSLTVFHMFK